MPQLVLYQPDLAHNLGSMMRLAACLGVPLHVVEPCGFPLDDKRIRQRSLDYGQQVDMVRHASWEAFLQVQRAQGGRLILVETDGASSLYEWAFQPDDWLVLGRESYGTPEFIYMCVDACVHIPMASGVRSLNVVMAGAMVLGEALRQTQHAQIPS